MRTSSVESFCHIAIMAQNLEAFRILILHQPDINPTPLPNFLSMLCAAAVNMIKRQKLKITFTATLAKWNNRTVCLKSD